MPASKKKAQLDPVERRSIALLWAYNGNDLVLLTFLPDERRFDEYCQTNRKNFRVLNVGTWFYIKYQRYVKCETRINVLDMSVLTGKPPLETRVLNAHVQLCVLFDCSQGNPYTDQYTYNSSLGNILLRKSQGGGPKQLSIWCSLQTVAWWGDPVMEEVVSRHSDPEKMSGKTDGFSGEKGTAKRICSTVNDNCAAFGSDFQLNDCRPMKSCGKMRNDFDTMPEMNCKMDSDSVVSITECNDDNPWDECLDDEMDVDPDFGETNGHANGKLLPVAPRKEEGGGDEEQISEELDEAFGWSHYDAVRSFDWENLSVGIVVERIERIEMLPNEPKDTILFSVFPFCTGERFPGILKLWTRQCLQIGQWISFRKSWSPFGSLNEGEYRPHPPMFRTLSFLERVIIECEVIFPSKKGDEIRTCWECPQNHLVSRCSSPTPFIRYIEDERGVFGQRFLGTRRWVVLEHVPMDWSPTKSWWKIVHVRPAEFDKLLKL